MVTSISWPMAETTGSARADDRPRHDLLVERPEVFEAAAAAGDDDQVGPGDPVGQGERGDDLAAAPAPWTRRRRDQDLGARQRRPMTWSRSRTAAPVGLVTTTIRRGIAGQGPLPARVEQPLGGEPGHRLAERQLQRPDPLGLEPADDELVLAPRRVDGHAAEARTARPSVRSKTSRCAVALPDHRPDLRRVVLEGEVDVPRPRPRDVRDLAVQRDLGELRAQRLLDPRRQVRDRLEDQAEGVIGLGEPGHARHRRDLDGRRGPAG